MVIEQIYTGCLAQGAYYIESKGEAVVIDPLREVEPYLQRAAKRGATIKYVFETHFHADFVSGHLDLAQKSGATIVYGPTAKPGFEAHVAADGETFKVGDVTFKLLHTPGHTIESSCYLLCDAEGKDVAIFTGDTLFIGDVGRPDLAQKAANMTQEQLAETLYHSLRDKIMPLADDLLVYPAHGAGSACGKKMSNETYDTLGHQKATNYALRADMTAGEFVNEVLTGLVAPPAYFPLNVMLNKNGYQSFDEVLARGQHGLSPRAFETAANETEALVLDTRPQEDFAKGFVPNSINIGIDGNFAPWVGTLVPDIKQTFLLITEPGREAEVITRLSRVGYDNVVGYLEGGFAAWQQAELDTDSIPQVSASEFADLVDSGTAENILDVRKASEYFSEHIIGAENTPLDFLNDSMTNISPDKTYYIHCAAGYRSMIFASALRARGYRNLIDVKGGFKAIKDTGRFHISDYVCPSTML